MNDKNRALLFDDNVEEGIAITLTDEDGNEFDAEVIAAIEIEELKKEFVAVLPTEALENFEEGEALILEYSEDWKGNPEFSPVEDDEMFEIASQAFNQFFSEMDGDDEEDEDEDFEYEDDYLDGEIIPGVTIKKE